MLKAVTKSNSKKGDCRDAMRQFHALLSNNFHQKDTSTEYSRNTGGRDITMALNDAARTLKDTRRRQPMRHYETLKKHY